MEERALETGSPPQATPDDDRVGTLNASEHATTVVIPHEQRDRLLVRLLELASQPFVVIDLEDRFAHVNRAFESLVGFSAEELAGMSYLQLTPETFREVVRSHLTRLRDVGITQRFESVLSQRDGQEIPVELVTDLYRDESQRPVGYYAFVTDIGERKRVEDALRSSEERFRSLYDEAPVGYHTIDGNGIILDVNRTECEMLGHTREEMVGRPIFDFVDDSMRDAARLAVAARVRGDEAVSSVERTYRTKDGRALQVAIQNRLVRDQDGQVVAIRSTVQDVTWRRNAEAALIASERRARALFEGIEDAVFVHDLEGHILDANPAASRRLGYSHEEFLRLTTRDIDDPTFATGFEDRLQRQLKEGHLRIEGRHRTKDGRLIPVDINTSTIQLEDQTAILAVIRDITDRKALEETRRQFAEAQLRNAWEVERKNQALVESEARYRQLTEASLDSIIVTDSEGRVTLFNPAAERTYGCSASWALGHACEEFFAEPDRAIVTNGLTEYVLLRRTQDAAYPTPIQNPPAERGVVGRTIELRGRRIQGEEFPVELSLSAAELAGELQFIFAIRDQTERQRMRTMLLQSERLASIGLLSAGLAHEINNPLAFIANNLAVLERDLGGMKRLIAAYEAARPRLAEAAPGLLEEVEAAEEDLDWNYVRENLGRMLGRTRDGVQRVASIVQNLRSLARTAPPKLEPASPEDLVGSALDMIRGRLRRRHIELVVEHADSGPILCVPTQIGQVILNLLINAIQAIEATERVEGNRIQLNSRQEAGWHIIEISDNGCGVPPEALPHLFDPFFTTKPVGEGTGLGLSISHGIVTGHGGRIEVESSPGSPTVFRVLLPRAGIAARNPPDANLGNPDRPLRDDRSNPAGGAPRTTPGSGP